MHLDRKRQGDRTVVANGIPDVIDEDDHVALREGGWVAAAALIASPTSRSLSQGVRRPSRAVHDQLPTRKRLDEPCSVLDLPGRGVAAESASKGENVLVQGQVAMDVGEVHQVVAVEKVARVEPA